VYPFALLVYLSRIIIPEVLNKPVLSGGRIDAEYI
jgi:hypothetical protein